MSNPQRRTIARQLLRRRYGATVEQLALKLETDQRRVRSLIDNLRRSGMTIENIAPCRFKLAK